MKSDHLQEAVTERDKDAGRAYNVYPKTQSCDCHTT